MQCNVTATAGCQRRHRRTTHCACAAATGCEKDPAAAAARPAAPAAPLQPPALPCRGRPCYAAADAAVRSVMCAALPAACRPPFAADGEEKDQRAVAGGRSSSSRQRAHGCERVRSCCIQGGASATSAAGSTDATKHCCRQQRQLVGAPPVLRLPLLHVQRHASRAQHSNPCPAARAPGAPV